MLIPFKPLSGPIKIICTVYSLKSNITRLHNILVALERCCSSEIHFPWSMSLRGGNCFAGRER